MSDPTVLIEFLEDETLVRLDQIVYIQALAANERYRVHASTNTRIGLPDGRVVYLKTPYAEVVKQISVALEMSRGDR